MKTSPAAASTTVRADMRRGRRYRVCESERTEFAGTDTLGSCRSCETLTDKRRHQ